MNPFINTVPGFNTTTIPGTGLFQNIAYPAFNSFGFNTFGQFPQNFFPQNFFPQYGFGAFNSVNTPWNSTPWNFGTWNNTFPWNSTFNGFGGWNTNGFQNQFPGFTGMNTSSPFTNTFGNTFGFSGFNGFGATPFNWNWNNTFQNGFNTPFVQNGVQNTFPFAFGNTFGGFGFNTPNPTSTNFWNAINPQGPFVNPFAGFSPVNPNNNGHHGVNTPSNNGIGISTAA